ncbi:MAG: response regulator [Clostridia bacterium]|nr:response regulator [Clostridia bacterium]
MTKILVVEDQLHNIRLMQQILEDIHTDIQVIKAFNGQQALEKAEEAHYDLVFMDVVLPDVDGIRITQDLKRNRAFANVPVIAVTAYAATQDEENFRVFFDDYVSKPLDEDMLTEKVKNLLGDRLK